MVGETRELRDEVRPGEESLRSEQRLNQLVDASRRLGSSLDLQTIYSAMIEVVKQAMPCEGLVVSRFEAATNLIHCDYANVGGNVLDTATFPPIELAEEGTGMQSTVIRTGRSLVFRNVQEKVHEPGGTYYDVTPEGESKLIEESHRPETQTALMVPVMLDGEVVGVVQVSSHLTDAYTDDHLLFLEGLVQQLAVATQNARLYELAQQEVRERRRAESALRESESLLWQTLDAMTEIAWQVQPDGTVVYVNRQLVEYSGVSDAEDAMGDRGWANVVHPDDAPTLKANYRNCMSRGVPWESEIRLRRWDGQYRWHISRMIPIRDSEGRIVRWFGTSSDIHDLKQANEELERRVAERTAELRAAVREMEGFTYSVSHDLRGPLRAMSATSKILLSEAGEALNDDMRSLLDRQLMAANRLGALIDALLRMSRISRYEMNRTVVDLTEIATSARAEIIGAESAGSPQIEVQPGMRCLGDEWLLRLVVHNLIENAVKFSPAGGQIEVGQSEDGAFFVRDRGVGFDMQYAEKLWIPFERLVRDDEFPGTGIGLANVKRIIERHGGKVWAESVPGQGSTFYFVVATPER